MSYTNQGNYGQQSGNYGGPNLGGGRPQSNQGNYGGNNNMGPQGGNYGGPSNFGNFGNPQGNYGQPQQPQQPQGPQYSAEANKLLSDQNMKLTMELASKDTLIDNKSTEIENLNNHSKQLVEQIALAKSSGAERVASLERAIQLLKQEIEEGKVIKARELESQRSFLQKEVDQAAKLSEDTDERVKDLSAQLEKIKYEQENEATRLSSFVTKTMNAFELTGSTSQLSGFNSSLLVESESNLGFSTMTLRSVVHPDGTIEKK